ncbi:MAG: bifunctional serine/threonine-protein kinase/formylglycine-generating enzyme family protein [Xenococcaceae cyanobacterium MO_188.B32]|nr:bifunctional serine/threonine-protein kinase/formylglycine-generating enzyme family protein [Xenococcaceae cyanobacterium MO_188.B32]
MSQCLNPDCLTVNSPEATVCEECGTQLLLVDRYRAIKMLGQGGFGRTFLAVDEFKPSKPRCVIKQFLPCVKGKKGLEKAAELFAQEAVRLDQLGQHDQIPELLACFSQENHQYLIQEFIDGENLAEELERKGVFNEEQIREVLNDMLSVLEFVHANQVIHRDIKPENIIRRSSDGKLILVDFGAAKATEGVDLKVTGTIIGSVAYVAPEQAVGKPTFASDLYSLGATCLHLLTNIEPTDLFDVAEGEWMWREYLEDNDISYELSRVLDKLVEGATRRRFESVKEVIAALGSRGGSVQTPRVYSPPPPRRTYSKTNSISRQRLGATSRKSGHRTSSRKTTGANSKLQLKIVEFDVVTLEQNNRIVIGRNSGLQLNRRRSKAKYITLDLGKGISMDLIGIPGGEFGMGSSEQELERGSEESPQHLVKIRPFLFGKYPVTQAQWRAIMGSNPSRFTDHEESDHKPVEKVSWLDCVKFCQQLSEIVGRELRLPTESEWEYACRGKTQTPFYFGETINTELANYNGEYIYGKGKIGEYRHQTTKVGSFPANIFGLYDMHGNVAEWCADTWHDNYQGAPTDGSAWSSNRRRDARILRGGSWLHLPGSCRSAHRLRSSPDSKSDAFGFRIASSV